LNLPEFFGTVQMLPGNMAGLVMVVVDQISFTIRGLHLTEQATILLFDDDRDFVNITRMILEPQQHRIISAADGGQGLAAMRAEKPAPPATR
jgi:PleD family two-component response regulator